MSSHQSHYYYNNLLMFLKACISKCLSSAGWKGYTNSKPVSMISAPVFDTHTPTHTQHHTHTHTHTHTHGDRESIVQKRRHKRLSSRPEAISGTGAITSALS